MAILQDKYTAAIVEVDDELGEKLIDTGNYGEPGEGIGWPARQPGDYVFGFKNIPGYSPAAVPPAQQVTTPPPPVEPEPPASGGETPAPEEPAPAPPPAPAPKRRSPKPTQGA